MRTLLYWSVGILLALLVAYNFIFQTYTFRYRMTVEVYSAGKVQSASSVIEASYHFSRLPSLSPYSWSSKVRGVAPIVQLGANGTLVASLAGGESGYRGGSARPSTITKAADDLPLAVYKIKPWDLELADKPVRLTEFMPQLIWLPPGRNDPREFKRVSPVMIPATIGSGTHLISITIEPASRAPLIERIPNAPEWLWTVRRYSAPRGTPERLPNSEVRFPQNAVGWSLRVFETTHPPTFDDWSSKNEP
ncbi:MAG: hypothetical protein NW217_16420 [Hyphomicrobiaceae bacterium]|nr:hypothetical protein [Hyphomicrobiaceae bacterium]